MAGLLRDTEADGPNPHSQPRTQRETIVAMADTIGATGRPRRRVVRVLGVAIALILIVGGYWVFTQGPGRQLLSPAGSTIASFSGAADQTTGSFQVRDGWAVHWDSTGQKFSFAIRGDRDFGKVIDINEPGSGVTSPTGAGTFHLEVTAEGDWTISITQGD